MSFLITVLPWIAKGALSGFSVPLALSVSLALAVFSLWKDAYVIEWVTFLCFSVDCLCFVLCVDGLTLSTISVLDTVSLTLASWGSVCFGKPLTLHYARGITPPKFWTTGLFFRINKMMTIGLGFFFFLEAVIKVLKILYPELLSYIVLSVIFKVGLLFYISFFPKWYRERISKGDKIFSTVSDLHEDNCHKR
jgi:hypothetical protein